MTPIGDAQLERYRFILMYDDERVLDAIAALQAEDGQDWWYLVVDLSEGGYAIGPYSNLGNGLKVEGERYLQRPLGDLVGGALKRVECLAEQETADYETVSREAAESDCSVAVILRDGEVSGVLPMGVTRGVFDVGVVNLAGKYAPLPEQGLLSPRRKQAKKKSGGKPAPPDRKPPKTAH